MKHIQSRCVLIRQVWNPLPYTQPYAFAMTPCFPYFRTYFMDGQSILFQKVASLHLQLYEKRDSGKSFFLWILRNFQEHLFYRTPPGDYFWVIEFDLALSKAFHLLQKHALFISKTCFSKHDIWVSSFKSWMNEHKQTCLILSLYKNHFYLLKHAFLKLKIMLTKTYWQRFGTNLFQNYFKMIWKWLFQINLRYGLFIYSSYGLLGPYGIIMK